MKVVDRKIDNVNYAEINNISAQQYIDGSNLSSRYIENANKTEIINVSAH